MSGRLTTEIFIEKARKVHGDKYYSKEELLKEILTEEEKIMEETLI